MSEDGLLMVSSELLFRAEDRIAELEAQLRQERGAKYEHPDSRFVNNFAAKMKDKLSTKRAEGKEGWDDPRMCSVDDLARWMVEHLSKGDPIDIANFCMMVSMRGEEGNGGAISRAWEAQVAQLQTTISQQAMSLAAYESHLQQSELREAAAQTTIGTLTAALQQIAFWTKNTGMQAIYSTADAALANITPKPEQSK